MPMTPEQAIFPGGYHVFDIVVACCLASARYTGVTDQGETVHAAFENYLKTLVERHPEMPLPTLMANAYTITLHDYRLARFDWLGEPLRAAWFEVAYESWALVAARGADQRRAGRARRGAGTRSGRARRARRRRERRYLPGRDRPLRPRRGQPPRRAEPRGVFRGLRLRESDALRSSGGAQAPAAGKPGVRRGRRADRRCGPA
jgi:hypothetical protein